MTSSEDDASSRKARSRRSFLRQGGALAIGTAALSRNATAQSQYDRIVNIVEAGADNTGTEIIDPILKQHTTDNTLVQFPKGRYLINRISLYRRSNFGMVAIDDDVTLVPASQQKYWIAGTQMRNFRFEGFTIDNRQEGIHPLVSFAVYDGLAIRNISKLGLHDGYNEALGVAILDSSGSGLLENVRMPHGSVHRGYNEYGYAKAATGIYADSLGTLTIRDCHIEGFGDNGLYASMSDGPVRVEGGLYKNNDVAQVRLGSNGSSVRGATIVVDDELDEDAINARGIRICDGPVETAGRVLIKDCDITLTGGVGAAGIVGAYNGGAFTVRDTRIRLDDEYTVARNGWASYGILCDNPRALEGIGVGPIHVERTSITGTAAERDAMEFRSRTGTRITNVCIHQPNGWRRGVDFDGGTDNVVSASMINVGAQQVRNATSTTSIMNTGTCPAPTYQQVEPKARGEVGTVSISQPSKTHAHSLSFSRAYSDPVVLMAPPSYNGRQPVHTRLINVAQTRALYKLEEWEYLDGWHTTERADYLVSESGDFLRDDETHYEVGTVTATHDDSGRVSFERNFEATPVVLTQIQTFNGSQSVVTRTTNVSSSGLEVLLQEEEGNDGEHLREDVGYAAFAPGTGTFAGRPFEAAVSSETITDEWTRLSFRREYENPSFFANIQTFNGADTASLRYQNLTASGVDVRIEEEQSADEETSHSRAERIGYVILGQQS